MSVTIRHTEPPGDDEPREAHLDYWLRRVLAWPLPGGTVENYAIPGWMRDGAEAALDRHPQKIRMTHVPHDAKA